MRRCSARLVVDVGEPSRPCSSSSRAMTPARRGRRSAGHRARDAGGERAAAARSVLRCADGRGRNHARRGKAATTKRSPRRRSTRRTRRASSHPQNVSAGRAPVAEVRRPGDGWTRRRADGAAARGLRRRARGHAATRHFSVLRRHLPSPSRSRHMASCARGYVDFRRRACSSPRERLNHRAPPRIDRVADARSVMSSLQRRRRRQAGEPGSDDDRVVQATPGAWRSTCTLPSAPTSIDDSDDGGCHRPRSAARSSHRGRTAQPDGRPAARHGQRGMSASDAGRCAREDDATPGVARARGRACARRVRARSRSRRRVARKARGGAEPWRHAIRFGCRRPSPSFASAAVAAARARCGAVAKAVECTRPRRSFATKRGFATLDADGALRPRERRRLQYMRAGARSADSRDMR